MTTNVYDQAPGILASDSRWSNRADGYLFYVDDVGYEKIVNDTQLAALFAGTLEYIDLWKSWFISGREGNPPRVSKNLSVCLIDMATGVVRLDRGDKIASSCKTARFAGTGAPHAFDCWVVNNDPLKAVATAAYFDRRSGGTIRHLNRRTGQNNLNNVATLEQLMRNFQTKGEVIMLNAGQTQKPIAISEAVNDPAVRDAFAKVESSGAGGLSAPFMGMGKEWTAEEEAQLYAVLAEYPPEPMAKKA